MVPLHPERREQLKWLLSPRRSSRTELRPAGSAGLAIPLRVHGTAAATKVVTRPRWLVFHVVVWALAATFVVLGLWQLSVSDAKHFDFFNFQYAVQWWLFAAFGIFIWIRVMRYRLNPPAPLPVRDGIVLRSENAIAVQPGSATLLAPGDANSDQPVIYRGYVMPQSSRVPVRSHGDTLHDAYNDFLWQLGVATGGTPDIETPRGASADDNGVGGSDPGTTGRELD